ncbi:BlaI/MecI/CopY family transcriptional regulator [Patescibacteria group bacterium]|nr:BlaI/MecI/CopY family transcriptional regulator [Patescibacteria group bacterium]
MAQKTLSDLEQQVMNFIWGRKETSVRDIVEELSKHRKIAYTTVATIVQRLENKGFVVRKEVGKTNFYRPKLGKEIYAKRIADSFIKRFVGSFGDAAIASFAEGLEDLSEEKRRYLISMLQKNEKNKH